MNSKPDDTSAKVVQLDHHRGRNTQSNLLSVLFVEDDEIDAELVEMALKKSTVFDIKVTRARNAGEVREVLSQTAFDLMLLDFWLGPDTGLSILEELGGRHSRIPVVLLTGYSSQDIQQLGHRAGALNFLPKDDVSANTLDAVIRSTLHTHELESELFANLVERDRTLRKKLDAFGQISRQIDQPLQSIAVAAAEIAEVTGAGEPEETIASRAQTIQDNALRVQKLVHHLIRQAQADQYHADFKFEPMDVGELIGKAIRLIGGQVADREQSVTFDMPGSPVIARIDQTAMLQALLNIVSNASKFSPLEAVIEASLVADGGDAVVAIRDHGIGMSETDVASALEPFGRVPLPSEFTQDGTGLGLPIASSILELHGGRIELNSEPDRGTEIKLIFPLER